MKRFHILALIPLLLLFSSACKRQPKENDAFFAPGRSRWVRLEQLPPDSAKEELLPTYRLRLESSASFGHLDLLEGVETLCGIDARWQDDAHLLLRLPVREAKHLLIAGPLDWGGVNVSLQLHEDQLRRQAVSADGQRRLVIIEDCRSGDWNLYLRRAGEPNFNAAMETGWDDPDLVGGFSALQPVTFLRWTGARSAEIGLPEKAYGVRVRETVGDVTVKWKFLQKLIKPTEVYQALHALPTASAARP